MRVFRLATVIVAVLAATTGDHRLHAVAVGLKLLYLMAIWLK
jgi:hypothetical protein